MDTAQRPSDRKIAREQNFPEATFLQVVPPSVVTAGPRTPLTLAVSADDGETWSAGKDLETSFDPRNFLRYWYCYPAALDLGDRLLLAYCAEDALRKLRIVCVPKGFLPKAPAIRAEPRDVELPPCGMLVGHAVYNYQGLYPGGYGNWLVQRGSPFDLIERTVKEEQGNLIQFWFWNGNRPLTKAAWLDMEELGFKCPHPDWKGDVDELWFEASQVMHARVAVDWMRFE